MSWTSLNAWLEDSLQYEENLLNKKKVWPKKIKFERKLLNVPLEEVIIKNNLKVEKIRHALGLFFCETL